LELNQGDTFLFYSDGLYEYFNPNGEIFDESRIKSLFGKKAAKQNPDTIIKELTDAATEWMGGTQPCDDMTLVVLKR
jgi:serine phosphatase RsbU (regulator of sigma subunit)